LLIGAEYPLEFIPEVGFFSTNEPKILWNRGKGSKNSRTEKILLVTTQTNLERNFSAYIPIFAHELLAD
jgi:hypothetical protein